eukprot:m51a1_g2792 hypothetical protein (395) ;mRNA; f:61620-63769
MERSSTGPRDPAPYASSGPSSSAIRDDSVEAAEVWLLVALFFATFVFAACRLAAVLRERHRSSRWSTRKAIHALLCVPILVRAIDMTVFHDNYLMREFEKQTPAEFILGSIPGYSFFSAYSLLLCLWVVLVHAAYNGSRATRWRIAMTYGVLNLAVWGAYVALVAVYSADEAQRRRAHTAEVVLAASIALTSGTAFGLYGLLLYARLVRAGVKPVSIDAVNVAKRMGVLAATFTAVFLLRSVIITVDWFGNPREGAMRRLRVFFQTVCEIAPTLLTLAVLWRPQSAAEPSPAVRPERDVLRGSKNSFGSPPFVPSPNIGKRASAYEPLLRYSQAHSPIANYASAAPALPPLNAYPYVQLSVAEWEPNRNDLLQHQQLPQQQQQQPFSEDRFAFP